MPKGKGKKGKIGGIKSTGGAKNIEKAGRVSDVGEVEKASAVGGVKGARSVQRKATGVMTKAERDSLFQMIDEEADKLFGEDGLPKKQQEVVQKAVKMAVDASIIDEDEKDQKKK